MVIFIILILPIHEHRYFYFLVTFSISFFFLSEIGGIHWSGLSPILLNLCIFYLWCYDAKVNRSVCIIPFSVCLVLFCRRAIDFCKLNLYSWLKLLIISKCFLLEFGGSLLYNIISPATIWLFPNCIPYFLSLAILIQLVLPPFKWKRVRMVGLHVSFLI